MARTAITLHTLAPNSSITAPSGDTADQTNGMNLALPSTALPASAGAQNLFFIVNNTAGTTKAVTIDAGVNPPALRSGEGALSVSIATTATAWIGPLESARFAQADGSINVDFASGFTGTIIAAVLPPRF